MRKHIRKLEHNWEKLKKKKKKPFKTIEKKKFFVINNRPKTSKQQNENNNVKTFFMNEMSYLHLWNEQNINVYFFIYFAQAF